MKKTMSKIVNVVRKAKELYAAEELAQKEAAEKEMVLMNAQTFEIIVASSDYCYGINSLDLKKMMNDKNNHYLPFRADCKDVKTMKRMEARVRTYSASYDAAEFIWVPIADCEKYVFPNAPTFLPTKKESKSIFTSFYGINSNGNFGLLKEQELADGMMPFVTKKLEDFFRFNGYKRHVPIMSFAEFNARKKAYIESKTTETNVDKRKEVTTLVGPDSKFVMSFTGTAKKAQ